MKLWQKIFLSSLVLIILVVNVVSLTLLNNNHQLLIEREQSHAINEHEYFTASFLNAVTYDKLISGAFIMKAAEVSLVAQSVVNGTGQTTPAAIYFPDDLPEAVNLPDSLYSMIKSDLFVNTDTSGAEYSIMVFDVEGKRIMAVSSAAIVEEVTCFIVTVSDISEIYALKEKQSAFVRRISIGASAVVSLILLFFVITLLKPLNKLNTYTKAIAGGRYDIRIQQKGSREFRELADNMNIMADAVQTHAMHLEKIAESRQNFIDDLAHEMKTPLTSILGFGDLLRIKKNVPDSERVEYATVIVEETKRLRSLSKKLMELVALGGTEIEKHPVSLPKLIKETETALSPLLTKNSVTLTCRSDDVELNADEELFKSLLYNIIENAVKASPIGGEIELNAEKQGDKTVLTVTDHGIGMTEEQMKRVFEPFYMADKSRSRKAGGAGLGLALCAEIAKLHSSELKIESKPNEGTSVFIIISEEGGK